MKNLLKNLLLFISLIASSNLLQAQISGPTIVCQADLTIYNCDQSSSTYSWSVSPTSGVSISNANIQNPDITFSNAGSYTVTVNTTGPVNTFTLGVAVNTLPIIASMSNQTICSGSLSSAINFTTTPAGGVVVSWTNTNSSIGISTSGSGNIAGFTAPSVISPQSGTISAIVTSMVTGCVGLPSNFNITVNPTPSISSDFVVIDSAGCGISNGSISGINVSGIAPFIYSWNGGAAQSVPEITNSPTGNYTLIVTDANGCNKDTTYTIPNNFAPEPPLVNSPITYCQNDISLPLIAASQSGGTINWYADVVGTISIPTPTPNTSTVGTTSYYVSEAVNGCQSTLSQVLVSVNPSTNISGTVTSNATPITSGQVYLYTQPAMTNMYYCIDTVSVNASGQYLFSSVTSGDYLVKCVPDTSLYPNAIGTYYGNAVQWDSSMVINHDCVNDFIVNINLIETVMMVGPGFVSGHVLEGAGFGGKMLNSVNEVMVPGGPIKNVCVNLMKIPGGGAHGQASTDSTGYFEFANVPIGSYYLQVDIPGLTMDSTYYIDIDGNMFVSGVNSTASSVFTNLDFMADDQAIFMLNAIGVNELKTETEEFSIYPNPAKNSITIKAKVFDAKGYGIELLNAQGQVVFTDKQNTASDYTLDLKKLNITSGLYVVKLSSGNVIKTTKLIIE